MKCTGMLLKYVRTCREGVCPVLGGLLPKSPSIPCVSPLSVKLRRDLPLGVDIVLNLSLLGLGTVRQSAFVLPLGSGL